MNSDESEEEKVWLITGCSTGMGREFARTALAAGYRVMTTARNTAGLMSRPGTGYYSTTKYAVEALSEALVFELAPFGIKVTAIQPGPFRTDWSGRSMKSSESTIGDYADSVHARMAFARDMHGEKPGDPLRAALAVVDLVRAENPPPQLLLGRIVLETYRDKLSSIQSMLDEWESLTLSADFPAVGPPDGV